MEVSDTAIISAWFDPVPMVYHSSSRLTETGELTLSGCLILIAKVTAVGFLGDTAIAFACSLFIAWFLFRVYYDFRYRGLERIIWLPPTANDVTLLHELIHAHLGHISKM